MKEKIEGAAPARDRLGKLYAMPLSLEDMHILLSVATGDVASVADIIAYGALPRGPAYRRVNFLAEEGYLRVERDTGDKRKVLLTALPKGLRWAKVIVNALA